MDVLAVLQEKLKEEHWTRATIENFNIKDLDTLEKILKEVIQQGKKSEAFQLCSEFIKNSPKSLTGLYFLGFLAYELEDRENKEAVFQVVDILKENKKWAVVERILEKVLEYEENIYALKILVAVYENAKKEQEKLEALQRLVKVDTENGDVAKKLAEYFEQKGQKEESLKYYKSALRRYAKAKQFSMTEQIWKKIAGDAFEDINFFLNIASITADSNLDLAVSLLTSFLEILEISEKMEEAIFVAKYILTLDAFNQKVKVKLVDLFKTKYANNSQLEECVKNSGLNNAKISVENAIKKFEKEILFDKGSYVYHKIWGIGKLTDIVNDEFFLNFDDKQQHKMSYAMALKSLIALMPDHIWVLKKEKKVGDCEKSEDIRRILLTILKSFPDKALSIENFKEELVPNILSQKDWNNWWNRAKNILKQEMTVGMIKEGRPRYILRNIKIRFEEELANNFFQAKKFDEKLKIFDEFEEEVVAIEEVSDVFREMIAYFNEAATSPKYDFNEKIIAYVLLKRIQKTYPWAVTSILVDTHTLMDMEKILQVLMDNYRNDYKKEIINLIDKTSEDALNILENILWNDRGQLGAYLVEKIQKRLEPNFFKEVLETGVGMFKNNPFISTWMLKYLLENSRYKEFMFKIEDLYIEILYRIDTLGKLMNQKKLNWFNPTIATPDAKRILSNLNDLLFKTSDFMELLLAHNDKDFVTKIYSLVKSSSGLVAKNKMDVVRAILKKYPDIDKAISEDISYVSIDYYDDKVIWTSQSGLERQQKKLDELKKEKQQNLIDLERAREKGDLRENAEYQAAREKDTNYNNAIADITGLLAKAKVFDASSVSGEEVTLGAVIKIERNGKEEIYSIMGFWDTDEKKHVIAYNSPLARAIMGAKKGEERDIELGGQKVKIKIIAIKPNK